MSKLLSLPALPLRRRGRIRVRRAPSRVLLLLLLDQALLLLPRGNLQLSTALSLVLLGAEPACAVSSSTVTHRIRPAAEQRTALPASATSVLLSLLGE